jgi:hypothetical protein
MLFLSNSFSFLSTCLRACFHTDGGAKKLECVPHPKPVKGWCARIITVGNSVVESFGPHAAIRANDKMRLDGVDSLTVA